MTCSSCGIRWVRGLRPPRPSAHTAPSQSHRRGGTHRPLSGPGRSEDEERPLDQRAGWRLPARHCTLSVAARDTAGRALGIPRSPNGRACKQTPPPRLCPRACGPSLCPSQPDLPPRPAPGLPCWVLSPIVCRCPWRPAGHPPSGALWSASVLARPRGRRLRLPQLLEPPGRGPGSAQREPRALEAASRLLSLPGDRLALPPHGQHQPLAVRHRPRRPASGNAGPAGLQLGPAPHALSLGPFPLIAVSSHSV